MMGKLRAIDRGTRYDITGRMRKIIRDIENGEIKPRNVLVITTESNGTNCMPKVVLYHLGPGLIEEAHWMLSTAKTRIEPS